MTIVLAHPSQSTLLTRRAGPAAAKRPSPPYWLAWQQRDPQYELEDLRSFYHRECTRAESIRRTVANRRKLLMRSHSSQPSLPSPSSSSPHRRANIAPPTDENTPLDPAEKPAPAPVPAVAPAPVSTPTLASAPTSEPSSSGPLTPTQEKAQALLGMYTSLLGSRLQSVERVSKMLNTWREHTPMSGP
ncbi:hypothetical protein RhiJN_01164 [Ceratobasidium sp. AG-Ba]|nr:hypothetical protein RhiJN_01164 [Ceratobasidium sp. AG-Ba]